MSELRERLLRAQGKLEAIDRLTKEMRGKTRMEDALVAVLKLAQEIAEEAQRINEDIDREEARLSP